MTRTDTATRRATTTIVAAVALFAAGDSYSHIYNLARQHGQGAVSAALLPLAGDGLIAAASAAMLTAARNGKPVPARARVLLLAGIGATVAANVAYGLPQGATGALLSVWPVACYVGCVEILSWMREHLGASARPAAASARTASARPPKPDAPEVPRPDAPEVPKAADLITAAVAIFPEAARNGTVPSLRMIQGEMKVGQGKAQVVQRHFLSLRAG